MYFVLADNAEESGPFSPEELHASIMEGRLHARTPLKMEAEGEWTSLDSFAEFAAVLKAKEAGMKLPPASYLKSLRHLPPRKSKWAIASLILGILGFATFGLSSVPGLICGVIAKGQINKSNGQLKGSKEALAGMILSLVSIVVVFLLVPEIIRKMKNKRSEGTEIRLQISQANRNESTKATTGPGSYAAANEPKRCLDTNKKPFGF